MMVNLIFELRLCSSSVAMVVLIFRGSGMGKWGAGLLATDIIEGSMSLNKVYHSWLLSCLKRQNMPSFLSSDTFNSFPVFIFFFNHACFTKGQV